MSNIFEIIFKKNSSILKASIQQFQNGHNNAQNNEDFEVLKNHT